MLIGKALGVRQSAPPSNPVADPSAERAYELDQLGVAAYRAGNLQLAADYFNQALGFTPNDSIIRRNLALAYNGLGLAALSGNDYASAVNLFQRALPYIPAGDPGYPTVANNLAGAQADLDGMRANQAAAAANQAAAARIKEVIGGYSDTQPAAPAGGSGGLGFNDFDGTKATDRPNAAPALGFSSFGPSNPPTDSSVVDARDVPSGLPKDVDEAIPHTPAGERERKGYEAIQAHDWKAALAAFQDALNHDPGNPGIQRLIDLATFTMAHEDQVYRPALDVPAPKPDDPQWKAFMHDYVPAHPELVTETRAAAAPVLDDPNLRLLRQAGPAGPLTDDEVVRRAGELKMAALNLAVKSAENEGFWTAFHNGPSGAATPTVVQAQAMLARTFDDTANAMRSCKCQLSVVLPQPEDMELLGL